MDLQQSGVAGNEIVVGIEASTEIAEIVVVVVVVASEQVVVGNANSAGLVVGVVVEVELLAVVHLQSVLLVLALESIEHVLVFHA